MSTRRRAVRTKSARARKKKPTTKAKRRRFAIPKLKPLPRSKATNAFDLLTEIQALIAEEPKRYNQHTWMHRLDTSGRRMIYRYERNQYPACGTVGCVAGWVVALKMSRIPKRELSDFIPSTAASILGIDEVQRERLFDGSAAGCGTVGSQNAEHAALGVAHIERFKNEHAEQLKAKPV